MFSGSLSTGDGDNKVYVRANREPIFVDGKAFVKAKIVFSINEPVYFWRLTQTFKIDELLPDTDIGMFYVAAAWTRSSNISNNLHSPKKKNHRKSVLVDDVLKTNRQWRKSSTIICSFRRTLLYKKLTNLFIQRFGSFMCLVQNAWLFFFRWTIDGICAETTFNFLGGLMKKLDRQLRTHY